MAAGKSRAAEMLRVDLAAAGIPYVDDAGEVFDFQALRHYFILNLVARRCGGATLPGVGPPRVHQHDVGVLRRRSNGGQARSARHVASDPMSTLYHNKFSYGGVDREVTIATEALAGLWPIGCEEWKPFVWFRGPPAMLLRKPLPGQHERIEAVRNSWRHGKAAFLAADCGTGKTFMAIVAAERHRFRRRTLILCPGHLCEKWKREIEATLITSVKIVRSYPRPRCAGRMGHSLERNCEARPDEAYPAPLAAGSIHQEQMPVRLPDRRRGPRIPR